MEREDLGIEREAERKSLYCILMDPNRMAMLEVRRGQNSDSVEGPRVVDKLKLLQWNRP